MERGVVINPPLVLLDKINQELTTQKRKKEVGLS